jgi:Recombination directionality factor-like
MPILDLQRRLVEVGRIRMGATVPTQSGGRRPTRLDNWRLTSRDRQRLDEAAPIYGGEIQPWEGHVGEYVLDTTVDNLPIMLLPGQTLSQWWELWSGGGAKRRCDGEREMLSDGPCLCPVAYDERADLAKEGQACKPVSRLSVLLPEIEGIGCWRLETHGYYAAVELAGTAQLLEEATRRGAMFPARLRIDQRTQIKAGKTTHFPVPVIDIDVRIPEMLAIGKGDMPIPEEGYKHLPAKTGVTVSQGLDALERQKKVDRANAAAPLGPPVAEFDDRAIPVPDEGEGLGRPEEVGTDGETPPAPQHGDPAPSELTHSPRAPITSGVSISGAQVKLLWTTIRELGVPDEMVRSIFNHYTGQTSSKGIPIDKFDAVLEAVKGATPSQFQIPESAR